MEIISLPYVLPFGPQLNTLVAIILSAFGVDGSKVPVVVLIVAVICCLVGIQVSSPLKALGRAVSCSIEVPYDDEVHSYLKCWLAINLQGARHMISRTRTATLSWLIGGHKGKPKHRLEDTQSAHQSTLESPRLNPIYHLPGYGYHLFRYKGHFILLFQGKDNAVMSNLPREITLLWCLGRHSHILKELIKEAQTSYYVRSPDRVTIYSPKERSDELMWSPVQARQKRNLDTVALEPSVKTVVEREIADFIRPETRQWFQSRGIPYKKGLAFYGPPGTGKTTFVFALACHFKMDLYVLNLCSPGMTDDRLMELFNDVPSPSIIVIEDIDRSLEGTRNVAVKSQKGFKPQAQEVSLANLLNIIDGSISSEGRILVISTNHIDRLDSALLRPGRIDRKVQFGYADREVVAALYRFIFAGPEETDRNCLNDKPPHYEISKNELSCGAEAASSCPNPCTSVSDMAKVFSEKFPEREYTPAEIQGYLIEHRNSPQSALRGVQAFLARTKGNRTLDLERRESLVRNKRRAVNRS